MFLDPRYAGAFRKKNGRRAVGAGFHSTSLPETFFYRSNRAFFLGLRCKLMQIALVSGK